MESIIKEKWEYIIYDNEYLISNFGKNYSYKSNNYLTPQDSDGYQRIPLRIDGKNVFFSVHRLVAEHFISNDDPINKNEVNHKDRNKSNNHVSNLEWVTGSENCTHAHENGAYKNSSKKCIVQQYDLISGETIETFESARVASEVANINYNTMTEICSGRIKKSGLTLYGWRYKDIKENFECPENSLRIRNLPYFITPTGIIWSEFYSIFMKTNVNRGYEKVTLHFNGERYNFYVHKLVTEVFLGPCPEKYQVNHKDSNPLNNNIENLEYMTASENVQYSYAHGNRISKLVLMINPMTHKIERTFNSVKEAAKELKINANGISSVLTGHSKTYKGWQWIRPGDQIIDLRENITKIEQLTLNGKSIEIHDAFNIAAKSVYGSHKGIKSACFNNKIYKGFLWKKIIVYDIPLRYRAK